MSSTKYLGILLALLMLAALGAPMPTNLTARAASSTGRLVFAHFMLAYPTGSDQVADYKGDITRAQKYNIDGFALNMGALPQDEAHNDYLLRADKIYQAAAELGTGFKLFISADTSSLVDPVLIQHTVTRYASHPNQLFVNGKQFLSTFLGQDAPFDWQASVLNPLSSSGHPVYFMPNFVGDPHVLFAQHPFIDGNFKWIPWMHATSLSQDLSEDTLFRQYSSQAGKTFMQGIAPWFFCHLPEKNWGNSEDGHILVDKWESILTNKPDYVEVVTWNDFSESTNLAPPNSNVVSQYYPWGSLDHTGFLELSSYYHLAFKNGAKPAITKDKLFYFYRTHSKNASPSNDGVGVPVGGAQEDDFIYVVSMLTQSGTVVITSGGSSQSFSVGAGITKLSMPFNQGQQKVELKRGSTTVLSSTGAVNINNSIQKLNFNVYSNFVSA